MSSFDTGWYLIYTRPRCEKKVTTHLSEENIDFYLPTMKASRNINNRRKIVETPFFPSYVFVYLKELRDYYAGLTAQGAISYVKFGKQIAKISDLVIGNLKIAIEKGTGMEVVTEYFETSQKLLITDGPFSGLTCEVVQHNNREKILVRINLLNRCVLVDMQAEYLVKHEPASSL